MSGCIATFTFTFNVGKDYLRVTLLGTEQEILMMNVSLPCKFSSNSFQEEFKHRRFLL